ncbi:MAG: hypothetical protein CSA76_01375 [Spirochaetales bacterium]|nr:MAG: hypothetical protein CSA76_01375 [Spirochaetales bacterium]
MEKKRTGERATIKDVAADAGVSIGTVSRYINGLNIRKDNRAAVEESIRKLQYRTDHFARSMKTGKSQSIGLIISGYDEFNMGVLSTLARKFQETGYALTTYHHEGQLDLFDKAMEQLLERNFDALAMSGLNCRRGRLEQLLDQGKPVVVFNNEVPGMDIDRVFAKDFEAVRSAVGHLLAMNHRRIGFITGNLQDSTAVNRYNGYRQALKDGGIAENSSLVFEGTWNTRAGYFGAKNLLSQSKAPTALFASNYLIAIGMLRALEEMGRRIPEDVSVISFDDTPFFPIFRPSITAIAQSAEEMGQNVASLLLDRLSGAYSGAARELRLDCRLILRDSVRVLP